MSSAWLFPSEERGLPWPLGLLQGQRQAEARDHSRTTQGRSPKFHLIVLPEDTSGKLAPNPNVGVSQKRKALVETEGPT